MKCQALHKPSLTRAWFEIEAHDLGVRIITPDEKEYWLVKEQVIKAMMLEVYLPKENNKMIEDLKKRFTYHAPKDNQPQKYEAIRKNALALAELIDELSPNSREKSLAITALEEAVMWANAAIARNE